jgi:PleD family two-component response regulator
MVPATAVRHSARLRNAASREDVQPAISSQALRSGRNGPTVLVVHSDPWVRALVRQVFLDAGYGVMEASNGASGLRALARSRPSAILIGEELSEICRFEFVEAVQTEFRREGIGILHLDQRLLKYFQNRLGQTLSCEGPAVVGE